jgi:hypothetical protein
MDTPAHSKGEALLPSRYPELDIVGQYKEVFEKLKSQGYSQAQALREVQRVCGGPSITQLRRYLIPGDFDKTKKRKRREWARQRKDPVKLKDIYSRRKYYLRAYRHLDELIQEAYSVSPKAEMTSREVSDTIRVSCPWHITFQPRTIIKCAFEYERKWGRPLLKEVADSRPIRYRLCSNDRLSDPGFLYQAIAPPQD